MTPFLKIHIKKTAPNFRIILLVLKRNTLFKRIGFILNLKNHKLISFNVKEFRRILKYFNISFKNKNIIKSKLIRDVLFLLFYLLKLKFSKDF